MGGDDWYEEEVPVKHRSHMQRPRNDDTEFVAEEADIQRSRKPIKLN